MAFHQITKMLRPGLHRRRGGLQSSAAITIAFALGLRASSSVAETQVEELIELDVEDLLDLRVVAASRHDQPSSEAPSAVTVVTAEEIRAYGYRTLADLLRGAIGFYTTYDRNYNYLGVRGFGLPGDYNTRVLLLLDGVRVNDNIYGLAPIGTDFILDLAAIDRVEIVRGPGSSLYGANAFFGVVNVITPEPQAVEGATMRGRVGSAGTVSGRVSYAQDTDSAIQWAVSGSLQDSKGQDLYFSEFDDPLTKNGLASGVDEDRFKGLAGKLIYRDFTAQAVYADRDKEIPTASFGTVFGDPRARTTDGRTLVSLNLDRTHDSGRSYHVHLSRGEYRYEGSYPYESEDPPSSNIVLNEDGCDGVWYTGEALVSIPAHDHRFILGTEVRHSTQQRQWSRYDNELSLDVDGVSTLWGAFAQAEAAVTGRLKLVGGVRHDRYESFGGTTNPRLAAILQAPGRVRLKLLYGTAFRAPNEYELRYYYETQGPLEPETITTRELIVERSLSKRIDGRVSVFDNNTQDLIRLETDEDENLRFVNAAAYDSRGVEIELRSFWAGGLRGNVRYSRVHIEDRATDAPPPNSATETAGANLVVPVPSTPVLVGSELRYMGSRLAIDGSEVEGHVVADLAVSARAWRNRVDVSVGIQNVMDKSYGDPGSEEHIQGEIRQDGRSVRLSVELRL